MEEKILNKRFGSNILILLKLKKLIIMNLDIRIPFNIDRYKLGESYNDALISTHDWILLLDHDVFLINPNWYKICLNAITKIGHQAGLISCRTNAAACPHQKINNIKGHDLDIHFEIAKNREKEFKSQYTDISNAKINDPRNLISGFFMITHKEVWAKVGGFAQGFLGIDNDYHKRIIFAGYKVYIIEELYCYHRYKRFWATNGERIPRNE